MEEIGKERGRKRKGEMKEIGRVRESIGKRKRRERKGKWLERRWVGGR